MIVSVTGHRPEKLTVLGQRPYPYNYAYDRLVSSFCYFLRDAHKVISGMALGADLAAAQAALYLDIPFIAAIPFEGQEATWPDASKVYYSRLLYQADEIVVVSEGSFTKWKYQVRNEWMVDHSDKVIALWDGSAGGTSNCVQYAVKKRQVVENVWDTWERAKVGAFPFPNTDLVDIPYGNLVFPSVENFFQAMKSEDERVRLTISHMSPQEAHEYGELMQVRTNWDSLKLDVMKYGLEEKFKHRVHLSSLIRTGTRPIVDWWSGDAFWGKDYKTGQGQNYLGKLLMQLRDERHLYENYT